MTTLRSTLLRGTRGVTLTEVVVSLALFAMIMLGAITTWKKAQEAYFVGSETAELQQNVRAAIDLLVRDLRAVGRDVTVCAFDYAGSATLDCGGAKVAACTLRLAGTGAPNWETGNGVPGGGPGCTGVFAIPFQQATASTLRIRSDRNDNGRIAGLGNATATDVGGEDVLYALATGLACPAGIAQCITRDDGTGPVAMVAVDINGFTLTYYPRPGFGPCAGSLNPCTTPFTLPLTGQDQADNISRISIMVQALQTVGGEQVSRTLTTDVVLKNRR